MEEKQWGDMKRKDKQEKENYSVTSFESLDPAVPEASPIPVLIVCMSQYISSLLRQLVLSCHHLPPRNFWLMHLLPP